MPQPSAPTERELRPGAREHQPTRVEIHVRGADESRSEEPSRLIALRELTPRVLAVEESEHGPVLTPLDLLRVVVATVRTGQGSIVLNYQRDGRA